MNRTTRAGFLIALWGMCLFFLGPEMVSRLVGFLWFGFGGYLFLKEE